MTEENLKQYTEAVVETESYYSEIAKRVLSEKLCEKMVVIYHTFEASGPSRLMPGDARRNFIVPFGKAPIHFQTRDINSASGWEEDHTEVFQFSFLIDENGVVHASTGSTSELSRVTGRPEN
ncbi:MAG: hypothetical protein KA715_13055 [Xanthomonadaceae bacterium]|nr:hypothetical protein [Xanthomonadaceae bacterium]